MFLMRESSFFHMFMILFLRVVCISCSKFDALLCGLCAGRRFFPMCIIVFLCVMCVFHVPNLMHCCMSFNNESTDRMVD